MTHNKTEVRHVRSVCDIDFEKLKGQGVEAVLFDIDGTITTWGGTRVNIDIVDCIQQSKLKKVGIVTNIDKKNARRAKSIADQINADSYQFPRLRKHRKPRAYMIESCIAELNTSKEKTVMVGDKLLDVLAAKNANIHAVYWTDMLHGPDHWFDRWIYRKIEPFLKKIVR